MATLIPASELRDFLYKQCCPRDLIVEGDVYVCPSRDWVFKDFAQALAANQFTLGLSGYRKSTNCCRHFAKFAMVMAAICHDHTSSHPDAALAFGTFSYQKDTGVGHQINFAVVLNAQGEKELYFFEPQDQQEAVLSNTEKRDNSMTIIV